jgi:leader peptidase (prepilin peptidase) / N-methyltransferase
MTDVFGVPLPWLLSPWGLGLLGLIVGSFLNVVIHRLPRRMERQWWGDVAGQLGDEASLERTLGPAAAELRAPATALAERLARQLEALPAYTLSSPPSACPACGHRIRWFENIPLVSWAVLRGKCSACGTSIAARYPLVELLTGVLFAAVAWRVGPVPVALAWCAFMAVLVAASAIDWDTTVLPDVLTLPLMWAGLLAAALGWLAPLSLADAVWGAVGGYLALWSVYWLFKLATGKEGMGFGDFKLLAALGAWLGWQALLPIVLAASAVGAVVGLAMKAMSTLREGRYVPFGPFLAGGGIVVMLLGLPRVLGWLGWV